MLRLKPRLQLKLSTAAVFLQRHHWSNNHIGNLFEKRKVYWAQVQVHGSEFLGQFSDSRWVQEPLQVNFYFLQNEVDLLCLNPSWQDSRIRAKFPKLAYKTLHSLSLDCPSCPKSPFHFSFSFSSRVFLHRAFAHAVLWPVQLFSPPFIQLTLALPRASAKRTLADRTFPDLSFQVESTVIISHNTMYHICNLKKCIYVILSLPL